MQRSAPALGNKGDNRTSHTPYTHTSTCRYTDAYTHVGDSHLLLLQLCFGGCVGCQERVRVHVIPQQDPSPVHLHGPGHARFKGRRRSGGHDAEQWQVVRDLWGRLQLWRVPTESVMVITAHRPMTRAL
jgi:hypothetical protein